MKENEIKRENNFAPKDQENIQARSKRSLSQGEHRKQCKTYQLAKYLNFEVDKGANIPLQLISSLDLGTPFHQDNFLSILGLSTWRCKRRQMFKNSKIRKAYSIAVMEELHPVEEEKYDNFSSII